MQVPSAINMGIPDKFQTKAPLDYDTKNRYRVTVTATDPALARDTITVTINVTDIDE